MDYVATHTLELMKALEDAHEKVSAICRSHFLNSTPAVWSFCNRVCKRISEQQNELILFSLGVQDQREQIRHRDSQASDGNSVARLPKN
jgi:hypothetical protein